MLNHYRPSVRDTELSYVPSANLETEPQTALDPRVEDFLDRVFARLVAVLPYEERIARRDAMRGEIEQSVAAHVELGSSRDEALALSFAQIQRESAVAAHAVEQVHLIRTHQQYSDKPATRIALGAFGLFYMLDQTRIAGRLWNLCFGGLYGTDGEVLRDSAAVAHFYRFELLVLPVLCGLAVGLLAKHRPARGTLNALALLAVPAIAGAGILYGLGYAHLVPFQDTWPEWLGRLVPNPIPAVCGIGCWAGLGALGATAGGWLRRRMPATAAVARRAGRSGRRMFRKPRWLSRDGKIARRSAGQ